MKAISKNFTTATAGTVLGGTLLFTAGMGIAGAEPAPAPVLDGLVNVAVGGTTILDSVTTAEAASASAAICGSTAPDVNALVEQVDTQGVNQTVCTGLPGGDLVLAQNVSVETPSPVVPGTSAEGSAESAEGAAGEAEEPAAATPEGSAESAEGDLTGAGAAEPPSSADDES